MLLEREVELAALGERLDAGAGGLVIVEGPAGIGKTSLLAPAAERAVAHGTRVLGARAAPLEQAYGFGVVRQLFEPVRAACGGAEWERLTADAAGLARRAPEPGAAGRAPGGHRPGRRRHARHAARAVLARGEPGRPGAAAPERRRRALGRPAVAALARL